MKKMILTAILAVGTAAFAQAGNVTIGLPGFFLSIGESLGFRGHGGGDAPHGGEVPRGEFRPAPRPAAPRPTPPAPAGRVEHGPAHWNAPRR